MTQPENSYLAFHRNLLKVSYNNLIRQAPFTDELVDPIDTDYLEQYRELIEGLASLDNALIEQGQYLLTRLVRAYPHLVPLVPRDLFWFFGGDCLHYMPDDEIALFQQLDELRFHAEENSQPFHYEDARAKLFGMH